MNNIDKTSAEPFTLNDKQLAAFKAGKKVRISEEKKEKKELGDGIMAVTRDNMRYLDGLAVTYGNSTGTVLDRNEVLDLAISAMRTMHYKELQAFLDRGGE